MDNYDEELLAPYEPILMDYFQKSAQLPNETLQKMAQENELNKTKEVTADQAKILEMFDEADENQDGQLNLEEYKVLTRLFE